MMFFTPHESSCRWTHDRLILLFMEAGERAFDLDFDFDLGLDRRLLPWFCVMFGIPWEPGMI